MARSLHFLVGIVAALCLGVAAPVPAQSVRLAPERGAAITDPLALRELDRGKFGLARMLSAARVTDAPLADTELFDLPSMAVVRKALDAEFERYVQQHRDSHPNETIGVDVRFLRVSSRA